MPTFLRTTAQASFAIVFAACLTLPAAAQDAAASKPKTAQQLKMASCNKDATGQKGDERKAFMSNCLKTTPALADTGTTTPQQSKMKQCNVDAKGKKGDERKAFMSTCLKG